MNILSLLIGTGLVASATQEVDATPLGYRDTSEDWLVSLPKVRTPKQKFFLSF